jgi:hypothetical protein
MPAAYLARRIVSPVNGSSFPINSRGLVTCPRAQTAVLSSSKVHAATKGIDDVEHGENAVLNLPGVRRSLIGRRL